MSCCDPGGYDEVFGERFARRSARRYRRRGLDPTATRLVDLLAADGVAGATVLEIGGGVGQIGLELLRRGAASVTSLELSAAYDDEANRLAREAGYADRVRRRVLDVASTPEQVQAADLVVLHRVVCCYPDHERLLSAVGDRCRRRLAFSHPARNVLSRGLLALENGIQALRGRQFRAFAHSPAAMLDVLERRGLRPVVEREGGLWQVEYLVR